MEQKTILDTIKELVKQKAELTEAINKSTQIAFVVETSNLYKLLADNKEIDISDQLKNVIINCFEENKRKWVINTKLGFDDNDNKGNTVTKYCYYCNGCDPYEEPQSTDINDEDFKKKINTAIEETPMSVGSSKITTTNNHIHLSQEIKNDYKTMLSANITADMNGEIEKIELHYTDDVEIKNQQQLQELNELLNQNLQNITEQGININTIMHFLFLLTIKDNNINIDDNLKKKFNFIYDKLLNLNQEYANIQKDVENLQYAIPVTTDKTQPINSYYLSLKAIKQEFPKYKNDIDKEIASISSKIGKFKTKLQDVNGNTNETIEATLNEMGKKLYDTEFVIGNGIGYKPNENKIIQSNSYDYYDSKKNCYVNGIVEIKLDPQWNIEYLLFINKTNKKTIKILPNIPIYINSKKFNLEDFILHHNAGFCTKWYNGGDAENSIKTHEQFEQIQQKQLEERNKFLKYNLQNKTSPSVINQQSKPQNRQIEDLMTNGVRFTSDGKVIRYNKKYDGFYLQTWEEYEAEYELHTKSTKKQHNSSYYRYNKKNSLNKQLTANIKTTIKTNNQKYFP